MIPRDPLSPQFVARRLKLARRERSMTQTRLAELSGLAQAQISRIEKASVQSLNLNDLIVIARALSLNIVDFLDTDIDNFTKTLLASQPAVPDDERFLTWTRHNQELHDELEAWLKKGKTISFDAIEDGIELFLAVPSLKNANVLAYPDDNIENMVNPNQTIIRYDAQADYSSLKNVPVLSFINVPELFVRRQSALVTVAHHDDRVLVSEHWRAISDGGWLHVAQDDDGLLTITQLMHTTGGQQLVEIPLWRISRVGNNSVWERQNPLLGQGAPYELLDAPKTNFIEDPLNPPEGMIPFGTIEGGQVVAMPVKGLSTHMYLCGSTGTGKSTMMEWIGYGLAKNNQSIIMMDPHGELIDKILRAIRLYTPERLNDVVLLDFGDTEHPVAINPIAGSQRPGANRSETQSNIENAVTNVRETVMKMLNLSSDSAPRAVNYVEQAIWAMTECNVRAFHDRPDIALTLLQVPDFFTNREFRQLVLKFCTNLSVLSTFDPNGTFEKLGERQQLDHVLPVLRTFSALAVKDSFGNTFGQSESNIDFAQWVKDNKIVLIKLPAIASDASIATFIGALMTPMLISSLSQWGHNKDLTAYLMIDEFQNYATESFQNLLAQTRKHGLYAIAANQVPQDLTPAVLRSIQSNTQTKMTMRLDPKAVKDISDFIAAGHSHPTTNDVLNLSNYEGWINHMQADGTSSGPFKFKGLTPPWHDIQFDERPLHDAVKPLRKNRAEIEQHRRTHNQQIIEHLTQLIQDKLDDQLEPPPTDTDFDE